MKPKNVAAQALRSGQYQPRVVADRKKLAKAGYRKHKGQHP